MFQLATAYLLTGKEMSVKPGKRFPKVFLGCLFSMRPSLSTFWVREIRQQTQYEEEQLEVILKSIVLEGEARASSMLKHLSDCAE